MLASSSSTSASVAVEKATSDLLIGPDWTMNIDICDSVNSHHWQAKDVMKAVKKRLQHKNPKVQLLALTLLETMVKNCGDYVHIQIAEKGILGDMVKLVKKKADMRVRDKILLLLDSWQEAFGGSAGKHSQYYWAYDDLRRSGIQFPQRSLDAAAIYTPPVSHPTLTHMQVGYGMPSNSSRRLDETMATEIETISLSSLDAMRNVMDLLSDMLQAMNPNDSAAVKDDVIIDLVNRCRANQKKLMQMLTTTGDEELLARGLELNDSLQSLLARFDAAASGSPLPQQVAVLSPKSPQVSTPRGKTSYVSDTSPMSNPRTPRVNPPGPATVTSSPKSLIDEEEEEEDDFALLARRHSKAKSTPQTTLTGMSSANFTPTTSNQIPCNVLALPEPPTPVKTCKEQDMIELLSLALTTTSTSSPAPQTPPAANQNMHQAPVNKATQDYPDGAQPYNSNQVPYNSYVVPWAQAQQPQQSQTNLQPQYQQQQLQSHYQPQPQSPPQIQYRSYSSGYPPPPWATTPGYPNYQTNHTNSINMLSTPRANAPEEAVRPIQSYNSFPVRGSIGSRDTEVDYGSRNTTDVSGQKAFIPSYRLFEDLNVLGNGNTDGRFKSTSSTSTSLSGTSGHSMVGGRK
ncbi:hypothetical protein ACFE04_001514 [Oxalis oulophora]